jgi:hypothetical protein
MRLGLEAGTKRAQLLDEKLIGLNVEAAEVDEIWCYVGKKQKHVMPGDNPREVGDQYVFVAMDATTTLVASSLLATAQVRMPCNSCATHNSASTIALR